MCRIRAKSRKTEIIAYKYHYCSIKHVIWSMWPTAWCIKIICVYIPYRLGLINCIASKIGIYTDCGATYTCSLPCFEWSLHMHSFQHCNCCHWVVCMFQCVPPSALLLADSGNKVSKSLHIRCILYKVRVKWAQHGRYQSQKWCKKEMREWWGHARRGKLKYR